MSDDEAISADDPRVLGLRRLVGVMDRLRGPEGCPWDRAQDHRSLRTYLLEETYELLEALDEGELGPIREELGDVLFQVVFHARLAEDRGEYDVGQVAGGIADKLIRRHPHVFADPGSVEDPAEVQRRWEELKRQEGRSSRLDGVPRALPSLARAQKVQDKAARVGFDWPDTTGPVEKLAEELEEVREAVSAGRAEEVAQELGDVVFTIVNVGRHLGVDVESALRETTAKFEARFRWMEREAGRDLGELNLEQLEALWQRAKRAERSPQ